MEGKMKKSAVMNTLKKKIREHKYKFTTQRQVILQAFLEAKKTICVRKMYMNLFGITIRK